MLAELGIVNGERTEGRLRTSVMFELLTRSFFRYCMMLLWLVLISPPFVLVFWLVPPDLESVAGLIGCLAGLVWLLTCGWLGATTTHRIAEDGERLIPAMQHTLCDLRDWLARLSLVGRFLRSDNDR